MNDWLNPSGSGMTEYDRYIEYSDEMGAPSYISNAAYKALFESK